MIPARLDAFIFFNCVNHQAEIAKWFYCFFWKCLGQGAHELDCLVLHVTIRVVFHVLGKRQNVALNESNKHLQDSRSDCPARKTRLVLTNGCVMNKQLHQFKISKALSRVIRRLSTGAHLYQKLQSSFSSLVVQTG